MAHVLAQFTWQEAPDPIRDLVRKHLPLDEQEAIAAVCLMDYATDLHAIQNDYLDQNPELNCVQASYVKYLPPDVRAIVDTTQACAQCMFVLLVAW